MQFIKQMLIELQNQFTYLKFGLLIFIGYPNSLMLSAQPDESSSIRRACSLSDLSMGKGNAKKTKITIHTFFCSNIIREYLRKRQRTYI